MTHDCCRNQTQVGGHRDDSKKRKNMSRTLQNELPAILLSNVTGYPNTERKTAKSSHACRCTKLIARAFDEAIDPVQISIFRSHCVDALADSSVQKSSKTRKRLDRVGIGYFRAVVIEKQERS